ncbi:hypothetical protein I4U23_025055 [Adineta vaga]|nr:hypothetical protein I4U23_025055 [Adineta vaga]
MFFSKIILVIVISFALADHRSKHDDMCPFTRDTLCVKDLLMTIAIVARSVNRTANEIERNILFKYQEIETLNRYINYEMGIIQSDLPTPQLHVKFFQNYLGDLMLEAHNALSYYYKSIKGILILRDIASFTSDLWFEQIENNLRYEMICRYRNVLSVYSRVWPSINEVNEIQFSRRKYASSPSMVHDVHAMVVIRLLREWMRKIYAVLMNVEAKYYPILMTAKPSA